MWNLETNWAGGLKGAQRVSDLIHGGQADTVGLSVCVFKNKNKQKKKTKKKKTKKKLEIESIYNVMFQVYSKVVRLYLCMYSFSDCFPL